MDPPSPHSHRRKRPSLDSRGNDAPGSSDGGGRNASGARRYRPQILSALGMLAIVVGVLLVYKLLSQRCKEGRDGADRPQQRWSGEGLLAGPFAHVAVNTDHGECTQAALDVMHNLQGNAVDGAIAALLCIGVVNLFSAGLGGGGFMLVSPSHLRRDDGDGSAGATFLDFRESAPARATADMFSGHPELAVDGPLAVAVPGELLGLWEAKRRFPSSVPWRALFARSVQLARHGFPMHLRLHKMACMQRERIRKSPALRDLLMQDDQVKPIGSTIRREKLADTLELIAAHGPDVLYRGGLGRAMVDGLRRQGGILAMADLEGYVVKTRPIYRQRHSRQYDIVTGGPPCSGLVVLFILKVLEHLPQRLQSPWSADDIHNFVEAAKFGYGARLMLGDPDHDDVRQIVEELRSDERAKEAARRIHANSTQHDPRYYQSVFSAGRDGSHDEIRDQGTTHVSIADSREGGWSVSVTSTINVAFGSLVVDDTTGILLNDEMDDFSPPLQPKNRSNAAPNCNDSQEGNWFGLPPTRLNRIRSQKRPQSSASPLIFYCTNTRDDGGESEGETRRPPAKEVCAVIGGVGGSKIISTVSKFVVDWLDLGLTPAGSVHLPRWHHQLIPDELCVEKAFYHPHKGVFSDAADNGAQNSGCANRPADGAKALHPSNDGANREQMMIEQLRAKGHNITEMHALRFYSGINMLVRSLFQSQTPAWYGATDPRKPGGRVDGF